MAVDRSYYDAKTHRLIPSRFPPISIFDWAESADELEQIAMLEGLSNARLKAVYGNTTLVEAADWVSGPGATPLMAAFTHTGPSRFSSGQFGVYYTADSLQTAIAETKYHREIFLRASNEPACLLQMREYTCRVTERCLDLRPKADKKLLNPNDYAESQRFGSDCHKAKEWGIIYPSVRYRTGTCVAIFRPTAVTLPKQGCHLDYIWDGECISDVRKAIKITLNTV